MFQWKALVGGVVMSSDVRWRDSTFQKPSFSLPWSLNYFFAFWVSDHLSGRTNMLRSFLQIQFFRPMLWKKMKPTSLMFICQQSCCCIASFSLCRTYIDECCRTAGRIKHQFLLNIEFLWIMHSAHVSGVFSMEKGTHTLMCTKFFSFMMTSPGFSSADDSVLENKSMHISKLPCFPLLHFVFAMYIHPYKTDKYIMYYLHGDSSCSRWAALATVMSETPRRREEKSAPAA